MGKAEDFAKFGSPFSGDCRILATMGSVIAAWRARLPNREDQARLSLYVERLADLVAGLRDRYRGAPVPEVTRLMSEQRGKGLAEVPGLRKYDGEVRGNLVINLDLFPGDRAVPGPLRLPDRVSALADAKSRGLRIVDEDGRRFVVLDRAGLHGVDFQIFDPRNLYPGSDRMGFVFLNGTGWPLLEGLMVDVAEAPRCAQSGIDVVRTADFHFSLPYLHLRYFLEAWCTCFFGWLRHYHVPGLEYNAHGTNEGFEEIDEALDSLDNAVGRAEAGERIFGTLLSDHGEEVAKWVGDLAGWAESEQATPL